MPARFRRAVIALRVALVLGVMPQVAVAADYVVRPGDTLSELAERHGVATADLAARNGLADPDRIAAGAVLALPVNESVAPAVTDEIYRVRPGDTLGGIAASFGTSVPALLAANPDVADPDMVYAGAVLAIPAAPHPAAAILRAAALRHGLDPALVQAVAWQESGWQQGAVSPAGAIGLLQLLPGTAAWVASDLVGAPLDVAGSATDNAEAGAALLAWLLALAGDEDLALAYYVQGQGSVAREGLHPETRAYVADVQALRAYIARHGHPPA
jgi:LysM repeat protein